MVERETIGDAGAAIVPDETEADVAKLLHHRDGVLGHQPLRVERALFAARRAGPAIAAQIHEDDGKALRELRRNPVPFDMGLRIAVQQQQRRSLAMRAHEKAAGGGRDPMRGEARKEIGQIRHREAPWVGKSSLSGRRRRS